MSDDILRVAEAEEQTLLSQLKRHPAFVRLEAVRALIATYRRTETSQPETDERPASVQSVDRRHPSRVGSMAAQVIDASIPFLRARNRQRAQVGEIYDAITASGVVIDHKNPIGYVSGVLSHSDLFDNVRGQGYGLVEWRNSTPLPGANPEPEEPSIAKDDIGEGVSSDKQLEEMLQ